MAELDARLKRLSRKEAKEAGVRWCMWHQAYEPIASFARRTGQGRPGSLKTSCHEGDLEARRSKRSRKPGYVPRIAYGKPETATPEGMKWCNHHQGFSPLEMFSPNPRQKDGRISTCRACILIAFYMHQGKTVKPNWKYNPVPSGMKWCGFHKRHEPLEDFYDKKPTKRDPATKSAWCRAGTSEHVKQNLPAYNFRWHVRRARIADVGGTYTDEEIFDIRRMQGDKCAYCRVALQGKGCKDHIIPIVLRGRNDRRNIQLTCRSCNTKKHDSDPLDFARSLGWLL